MYVAKARQTRAKLIGFGFGFETETDPNPLRITILTPKIDAGKMQHSQRLSPGGFLCLAQQRATGRPVASLYTVLASEERIYQRGGVS